MAQIQIRGNTQIKAGTITEDRLAFNIATQAELDAIAASVSTNATNIATNQTNIAQNTTDIATNATNIATNTADIATNASNISANTTAIGANTANITANTNAITTLDGEVLKKAQNLADVPNKATARTNLEVDSSSEVDAKIAAAGLALGTNYAVANHTEKDALTGLVVGDNIYITDDGDGKWATYTVTAVTDGAGSTSTYEKLMDEDVYLNAISASSIKASYESNADTNAFTDAYKTQLDNLGSVNTVVGEEPTVVDASTDVTLANTPTAWTLKVYLNGLRTKYFTLAGAVVSFSEALETGDEVYADYNY